MGKVFARIGMVALLIGLGVALTAPAAAATINVGGVKVQYSREGFDAFYNGSDDTLTIVISEGGGTLVVTATSDAYMNWGGYVDTVIFGYGVDVKNIFLKGRPETAFFVAGEMNSCQHFMVKNGFVGGTDYYGDAGLYSDAGTVSTSIKIFNGVAIGPVFVYSPPAVRQGANQGLSFVPPAPGFDKQGLLEKMRQAAPAE